MLPPFFKEIFSIPFTPFILWSVFFHLVIYEEPYNLFLVLLVTNFIAQIIWIDSIDFFNTQNEILKRKYFIAFLL